MSLPVTNLDDRKFQDLVDEAKRMIPQLCPEWTNHNLSDPGVALVAVHPGRSNEALCQAQHVQRAGMTVGRQLARSALNQRAQPAG